MTNLAVITGGLSVGLGFGLRDIVNNFLSSLIILLSHSIRHGDIIEIDGTVGKVLEITIRSTLVQTNDNAIVSIPNSEIISRKLINWTSNNPAVKKDIKVGVSYDSNVEKVKYILLDIAKNTEHVLSDPHPSVVFSEFANSTLDFILHVWIDDIRISSSITSLIREKINTEFKSNGIEMAYPQLDVNINYPEDKTKNLNI
jgi:small-conductance mechanosensitive channel